MEPKQAIITAHEANKAKESYFQEKLLPQIDQMIRSASSSGKDDVLIQNSTLYFNEIKKTFQFRGFDVHLIKDSSTIKIVWGNLVPQPVQEPIDEIAPEPAKSIRNSFPYQNDLYARTKEEKLGNMFYALEHVTQTLEEISKEEDNDILIEELFQTFRTDYFFRLFRETFKRGNEKKENAETAEIVKNYFAIKEECRTNVKNDEEDFSLEIIQQKTKSVDIEKLVENWNRGIRFAAERGHTDFSIDLSNYDGRKDEISSYYRNKGFNVSLNTLNGLNLMNIYWFQSIS